MFEATKYDLQDAKARVESRVMGDQDNAVILDLSDSPLMESVVCRLLPGRGIDDSAERIEDN